MTTKSIAAVAAAMILWAALAVAGVAPAAARYQTVVGEHVQWEWSWTTAPGRFQMTDVVVRDDGWMIVATAAFGDGFLHLIPPWGAPVAEENRFGPEALGFRQLELRRGRLFGLRQEPQRRGDDVHNPGELIELDATTGAVVRHHGSWWHQDLAVDPATDDLVLQTSGDGREPYPHHLVRYNPDRGTQQLLVADEEPRSDRALEVAFSPDGALLFTANVTDLPPSVDVRRRDGTRLYSLQSGQVDTLVTGRASTCFAGLLLITRWDGSVWALPSEPGSAPTMLAAAGRPGVVSYAALDRDGHLLATRHREATLLACPPFVPPKPPTPAVPGPPALQPPVAAAPQPVEAGAAAAAPAGPTASAPVPQGPPPPVNPPPPAPPTPAAPVATPSAFGGAVQAAGAPSVGAADSPDEEHITSVAASSSATLALSLGAVVAMSVLAFALVAIPPPDPRVQRVRGTP